MSDVRVRTRTASIDCLPVQLALLVCDPGRDSECEVSGSGQCFGSLISYSGQLSSDARESTMSA